MPLLKERGHPWYWNEVFLIEIFCWIKPKSKSDIWAQSNKKAMLDARLLCMYCAVITFVIPKFGRTLNHLNHRNFEESEQFSLNFSIIGLDAADLCCCAFNKWTRFLFSFEMETLSFWGILRCISTEKFLTDFISFWALQLNTHRVKPNPSTHLNPTMTVRYRDSSNRTVFGTKKKPS